MSQKYEYARLHQEGGGTDDEEHRPTYYQSNDQDPSSASAPLLPDSSSKEYGHDDSETEELNSQPESREQRSPDHGLATGFVTKMWKRHQRRCVILSILAIAVVGTITQHVFSISSQYHDRHHHHHAPQLPFFAPMTDQEIEAVKQQLREHSQETLMEQSGAPLYSPSMPEAIFPFMCQHMVGSPSSKAVEIPLDKLPPPMVLDSHLVKLETFDDNLAMHVRVVTSSEVEHPTLRFIRGHVRHAPSFPLSPVMMEGIVFKMEKKKHRHHQSKTTKVKVKLMLADNQAHKKQIAHCRKRMAEQGLAVDEEEDQDEHVEGMGDQEESEMVMDTEDSELALDEEEEQTHHQHHQHNEEIELKKSWERQIEYSSLKGKREDNKAIPRGGGLGIALAEAYGHHHHHPHHGHKKGKKHGHKKDKKHGHKKDKHHDHKKGKDHDHNEHCSCFFTNIQDIIPHQPALGDTKDSKGFPVPKPCVSLEVELILPATMGQREGKEHRHHDHLDKDGVVCSLNFDGPHLAVHISTNSDASALQNKPFHFKSIHIRNKVGLIHLDSVRAEHLHVHTDQGLVLLYRMMARRQKRHPAHEELRVAAWPVGPVNLRLTEKGRKRVILDVASGLGRTQSEMPKGHNARFSVRSLGIPYGKKDLLADMIKDAQAM